MGPLGRQWGVMWSHGAYAPEIVGSLEHAGSLASDGVFLDLLIGFSISDLILLA